MTNMFFSGVDFSKFWIDSDYSRKKLIEAQFTPDIIFDIEHELGYKLPLSYIALMKTQNGGSPINDCFPTNEPTSWAEDHVAITSILGIGRKKDYSLCGNLGSQFHIDEWGYPPIGVYFGSCPSAGHDLIALDYRKCGVQGEPEVVHVDQECDYKITYLAQNFEAFILGLVHESTFDTE